jgi:hypothetical protein
MKEITYGTLSGGLKNGQLMYELVFDEQNNLSPAQVVSLILSHESSKCKRAHFTGTFGDGLLAAHVASSLRSLNFALYITQEGTYHYPWAQSDGSHPSFFFKTIKLNDPNWAPLHFSELIFELKSKETPEPLMAMDLDLRNVGLFIQPEGISDIDLFKYIDNAKLAWNINTETRRKVKYLFKGGN